MSLHSLAARGTAGDAITTAASSMAISTTEPGVRGRPSASTRRAGSTSRGSHPHPASAAVRAVLHAASATRRTFFFRACTSRSASTASTSPGHPATSSWASRRKVIRSDSVADRKSSGIGANGAAGRVMQRRTGHDLAVFPESSPSSAHKSRARTSCSAFRRGSSLRASAVGDGRRYLSRADLQVTSIIPMAPRVVSLSLWVMNG